MKTIARLFMAFAMTAALSSCAGKVCKVEGTVGQIDGCDDIKVMIVESRDKIDTLDVVDGRFSCTLPLDEGKMYNAIVLCDGKMYGPKYSTQFITDSKKVTVVLDKVSEVSGSPLTDAYRKLREEGNAIARSQGYDAYLEFSINAYEENCQNIIGEKVFQGIARELSLADFDELLEMGTENMKSSESYKRIRASKAAAEASAINTRFLDFSGVSPEGAQVKLSDYVGRNKLTLVDFWASWCGPCMRSMPAMVKLWNTYHKKGLDIVGVAVWDGDNSASRVKMEEKGMVWPQIFTGEDMTPTSIYGIDGIPHVILIDAEGTILLRGIPNEEEIEALVSEKLR